MSEQEEQAIKVLTDKAKEVTDRFVVVLNSMIKEGSLGSDAVCIGASAIVASSVHQMTLAGMPLDTCIAQVEAIIREYSEQQLNR